MMVPREACVLVRFTGKLGVRVGLLPDCVQVCIMGVCVCVCLQNQSH